MLLTLASQSPARLATLRAAGVEPDVIVSGVDESGVTGTPADVARELATLKCRAVAADLSDDALVLGCDSVLELDGEALGKPADAAEATLRWQRMRGRSGVLHTGHCLRLGRTELVRGAATTVHFADVSDAEIEAYVATGEPLHVAGAFTVDGRGGAFVTGIEGDHHNVVGLSLPLLRTMLTELGVAWTDLWGGPALLVPSVDTSPAAWIVEAGRHEPWGRLVGLGPAGFEAYARQRFLPDPTAPGQEEGDVGDEEDPRHAEPDALWEAMHVLASFTTTPDDVHVALWDGWGDDLRAPRFHIPNRAYHLFRGRIGDLRAWPYMRPAMIWPDDRAWFVAFDVDPHYAGIAASRPAIEALANHPLLDVVPADLEIEPPHYG